MLKLLPALPLVSAPINVEQEEKEIRAFDRVRASLRIVLHRACMSLDLCMSAGSHGQQAQTGVLVSVTFLQN